MRVFGGTLAEFGLHDEAAGGCVGHAGFETLENLDPLAIASAQLHRLRNEAAVDFEEDHGLLSNALDSIR